MISTGDLKRGIVIELDGEIWQVLDYHHIKMGRGSAQVRIKLRNIKRGQTVERTFQAGEKWPRAYLETRQVQFLYSDGNDFHFMDSQSYEQFSMTAEKLGDAAQYLTDGMTLDRTSYESETIGVELPVTVEQKVIDTEPGFAGDTTERRAQAGHDRDRPRRPGAALRRASATRSASTPEPASTRPASDPGRSSLYVPRVTQRPIVRRSATAVR